VTKIDQGGKGRNWKKQEELDDKKIYYKKNLRKNRLSGLKQNTKRIK